MSRIAIPGRDDAPLESQPILDNIKKIVGFVPNLQRLMSISPNALAGWARLMGSLSKTLDIKTRDAIALAVSEADGCNYGLAAHSYIAMNLAKISPEEISLNREGRSTDPKRQVDRRQHRRDDRAGIPVPADQLHEQRGADADRLPRSASCQDGLSTGGGASLPLPNGMRMTHQCGIAVQLLQAGLYINLEASTVRQAINKRRPVVRADMPTLVHCQLTRKSMNPRVNWFSALRKSGGPPCARY
jgi:AhpD family alkylhydroperoxidase